MKDKLCQIGQYLSNIDAFFFFAMLGFAFPLTIKTSLTGSGIISIYISQLIYILCGIYFFIQVFRERKIKDKTIMTYLLLCAWYVFVTIWRYLNGNAWYASLQVCFWTIIPIAIYILISMKKLDYKKACTGLYYAMSILNALYFVYHIIIIGQLRSTFLGNINMIVFYSILGMYIYTFYYLQLNTNANKLLYVFNMEHSFFIILFSGSRAGVLVGVASIFVLFILHMRNNRFVKSFVITVFMMIIIMVLSLTTNFCWSRDMFFRGTNLGTVSESIMVSMGKTDLDAQRLSNVMQDASKVQNEQQLDSMIQSASESGNTQDVLALNDVGRIMMWKNAMEEIKKSPLVGTGVIGVYRSLNGNQLPHNVILEYWLTYGGIGVLLWVILAIEVLCDIFKRNWNEKKNLLYIVSYIIIAMAYSMVQPTMSNTFGPLLFWCGIGIFLTSKEKIL